MIYEFNSEIQLSGSRAFIPIPMNVWEETGRRGNIPCRIDIGGNSFECKLTPKGNGVYWIPIGKSLLAALPDRAEFRVTMEPLSTLTRINRDSPYSKEKPIRKIDGINPIPIQSGFCGHCCVAMLAGVELKDAIALMGKEHASWSKILEALDYYGISYAEKAVYPKNGDYTLPPCCIVRNGNSFLLWFKGAYIGVSDVDKSETVSYLEILLT